MRYLSHTIMLQILGNVQAVADDDDGMNHSVSGVSQVREMLIKLVANSHPAAPVQVSPHE